jgi:hypothetical protein
MAHQGYLLVFTTAIHVTLLTCNENHYMPSALAFLVRNLNLKRLDILIHYMQLLGD